MKAQGCEVSVRSAASQSPFDVISFDAVNKIIYLDQCKNSKKRATIREGEKEIMPYLSWAGLWKVEVRLIHPTQKF